MQTHLSSSIFSFSTSMDALNLNEKRSVVDYRSTVDTSSPFRSVKEAVAIFGERLLAGELYAHNPFINNATPSRHEITSYRSSPCSMKSFLNYENYEESREINLVSDLKKLDVELEETKVELKLLKEKESETEITLASLNAELHDNMSRMAQTEAEAAAPTRFTSNGAGKKTEEERKKGLMVKMDHQSPTLAQIFSVNEKQAAAIYFGGRKQKKPRKKKPIIPLIVDLFSLSGWKKKPSATSLHNPLYTSHHGLWN